MTPTTPTLAITLLAIVVVACLLRRVGTLVRERDEARLDAVDWRESYYELAADGPPEPGAYWQRGTGWVWDSSRKAKHRADAAQDGTQPPDATDPLPQDRKTPHPAVAGSVQPRGARGRFVKRAPA